MLENQYLPDLSHLPKEAKEEIDIRIEKVNIIIRKIASLDRKFFEHNSSIDYIFRVNQDIYMRNGYNGVDMKLGLDRPVDFSHGGTIWGLTKDFVLFILHGNKCNGQHGYGGLYCKKWGYKDSSMEEIIQVAKNLQYL